MFLPTCQWPFFNSPLYVHVRSHPTLPLFASSPTLLSGCHVYGLSEVVGNSETRCGQDDQASSSKCIRTAHDDDVVCVSGVSYDDDYVF